MVDVLVHTKFPKAVMEPLMQRYDSLYVNSPFLRDAVSPEQLAEIQAIVLAGGSDRMNKSLFDAMPRLRAVICFGSGYDNVDFDEASKRGVVVGHSPGANSAAVAEHAVALLMAAVRQVVAADSFIRSGDWARKPSPFVVPAKAISDRRVGIYGVGAIGRRIIPYIVASGAEVAYCSRSHHEELSIRYMATLEELADWADTLIIAVRAGANNHHAVNEDILRRLGPDGVVVNVARGTVVDQTALGHALRNNVITAAALDVFEKEPAFPTELVDLPNIVLSPHMGGNTLTSRANMLNCVMANLDAFFANKPLAYPVRPSLAGAA
jgi:hydroxypyruvate reductase